MSALTPRMSGAIVCLLVLIVGVPVTHCVSVDCSSKLPNVCTWSDGQFNRAANWKVAIDSNSRSASYCLVPNKIRSQAMTSSRSSSAQAYTGSFLSGWIVAEESRQNPMCLQFNYKFFLTEPVISKPGLQLALLKRTFGSCSQESTRVRQRSGKEIKSLTCHNEVAWRSDASDIGSVSHAGSWTRQKVSMESGSDFKLIFEGTIPANNPNARICVDNITAYHRPCHQIAASAYEASMRRWLEPMVFIFIGALAFALIIAVSIFAIRVNRRRSKKLSPGSSEDGSASPQRPNRQQHHRRQQEAMLLHAERLADGPASGSAAVGAVPIGHGHGPRRPAPPVPAEQPSLDELLSNGHRAAASATAPAAAAGHNDPPPRYEEAMGLVASAAAGSSSASDQLPPPHPPRLNRRNGGHVV